MLSPIRIFMVDDHELVRAGIKRILADVTDMELIGEAGSGEEALQTIPDPHPDIVLVDLNLLIDGEDITYLLLKQFPHLKILIVSICLDELLLQSLFQAGICGYLSKTSSAEEMLKAIRVIAQGGHYIDPEVAQTIVFTKNKQEISSFDVLSERELQVALMIIEGRSIPEISRKLDINRKTINSYRSRSFQKLGVGNDVELTLLAYRQRLLKHSLL